MRYSTESILIVASTCFAGLALSCLGGLWALNQNVSAVASLIALPSAAQEKYLNYVARIESSDELRTLVATKTQQLQSVSEIGLLTSERTQVLLTVIGVSLLALNALLLFLLWRSVRQAKPAPSNSDT